MKKKNILLIQCGICSLFAILILMLPYVSIGTSGLDQKYKIGLKGYEILKYAFMELDINHSNLMQIFLSDMMDSLNFYQTILKIVSVIFLILPCLGMLISAVVHIIFAVKDYMNRVIIVIPTVSIVLVFLGYIIPLIIVKKILNAISGGYISVNALHITPGLGWILFVLIAVAIIVEDIFIGRIKNEKENVPIKENVLQNELYPSRKNKIQNDTFHDVKENENWEKIDDIEDYALGENRMIKAWSDPNTFERPVFDKEKQTVEDIHHGSIIGMTGEYEGLIIPVEPETPVIIGRHPSYCNLLLDNLSVSRKHCTIAYHFDSNEYVLENYSKNGVYLSDGRQIGESEAVTVLPGSVFYVSKVDSFRLG